MSYNNELCKLIIENIELLEEAPGVISSIEKLAFQKINHKFKAFFVGRAGWKDDGVYDYFDDDGGETSFASASWPVDDDGAYAAYYQFSEACGDLSEYYLSILTGKVPKDNYGIFFDVDANFFGMNKRTWKAFLQNQYQLNPKLGELGVEFSAGRLCIPIILDATLVAKEYPDLEESLNPVDDALAILMEAHLHISGIVEKISAHHSESLNTQ